MSNTTNEGQIVPIRTAGYCPYFCSHIGRSYMCNAIIVKEGITDNQEDTKSHPGIILLGDGYAKGLNCGLRIHYHIIQDKKTGKITRTINLF